MTFKRKSFSIIRKIQKNSPHKTKFHDAPCHIPLSKNTIEILKIHRALRRTLFPPNEKYTYSVNHDVKEICHRCQNSFILVAKYGKRKFCVILNPRPFATPKAISEYPLKSQYICMLYKIAVKANVEPF